MLYVGVWSRRSVSYRSTKVERVQAVMSHWKEEASDDDEDWVNDDDDDADYIEWRRRRIESFSARECWGSYSAASEPTSQPASQFADKAVDRQPAVL